MPRTQTVERLVLGLCGACPGYGRSRPERRGPFRGEHSFLAERCSERPGAVKGAPQFGAAQRTLDGEDRSERIPAGRNGPLTAASEEIFTTYNYP